MSLKIVFMGTPEFSVPTLKNLINSNHEVICVYTQSPKKKSRGQKILKTPIHILSEKEGIEVRTSRLTEENEYKRFIKLNPDLVVVVAYGQIIPEPYLKIPDLLFLNIHASLLPKWRGAAPIERAILNKDKQTGVSIMKIENKLDAGPYLKQIKTEIMKNTTGGQLRQKLSEIGAVALIEVINLVSSKKYLFTKQDEKNASYAKKIEKGETKINWSENAKNIVAKINAFNPKPGAWFQINLERIKILEAIEVNMQGQKGEILDNELTIGCSQNAIKILKIQKEGKRILSASEFLVGNKLKKGTIIN